VATHFSTIGLALTTDEELIACIERVLPDGEKFPTAQGTYVRWADPSGAELWIQQNAEGELVGVNPHFCGRSRVRALLTHMIDPGSGNVLDGRFHGWADPAKAVADQSGSYPFLFDAPDAACHCGLTLPTEVEIQVAAFAHDVQVFDNPRAYDATQTSDTWHTSQSFIPSGLIGPGSGVKAEAAFNGHVVRAEKRTNRLTGIEFVWCLVNCSGGSFDVVADPEVMPKVPPVGGVISGDFWLTGRIGACLPKTAKPAAIMASDNWRRRARVERR
jgi:hypothetical protein